MVIVATLEIALTCLLADDLFAIYYVFIAIYAAYVFQDRRAIVGPHRASRASCITAPIAYDSGDARENAILALTLIPTVIIAAGVVAYLRERLEASEARFRLLAERDPLTGVGNYRLLSQRFPEEMERHSLRQHPLALIVIDLNDFKRVNDEHGHQYGDRVLQEVAGALMGSVRSTDIVDPPRRRRVLDRVPRDRRRERRRAGRAPARGDREGDRGRPPAGRDDAATRSTPTTPSRSTPCWRTRTRSCAPARSRAVAGTARPGCSARSRCRCGPRSPSRGRLVARQRGPLPPEPIAEVSQRRPAITA